MNQRAIRVLLVVSDRGESERIGRALGPLAAPVELATAATLREAESAIEQSLPDLVIADADLPDGKGTGLLPSDKKRLEFPLVILGAEARVAEAVEAITAGASDYVVKSEATWAEMSGIAERALCSWQSVLASRREEDLMRHRGHLEELVQERTAELAEANRQLQRQIAECERAEQTVQKEQRLLRHLLDLQERDRKLIAYEIHDGLAQQLAGAQMAFQSLRHWQDRDPDEVQHQVNQALGLLDQSLTEVRRLIGGLRPPILDELGIVAAIDYLVHEVQSREGVQAEFAHKTGFKRLAAPLEAVIFRIVQESLTNACRHSQTDKIRVKLVEHDDGVRVEVRDWGVGFDPEQVEQNRFGLQGIRERARLFGGRATIDAAPGRGTRIAVELPLLEEAPGDVGAG